MHTMPNLPLVLILDEITRQQY